MQNLSALFVLMLSVFPNPMFENTPEGQRAREQEKKAWHAELAAHYDFAALRAFLAREIGLRPQVDGVSLAKAVLAEGWEQEDRGHRCGDWLLRTDPPRQERFTVAWTYERITIKEDTTLERRVTFHCLRKARNQFTVEKVERADKTVHFTRLWERPDAPAASARKGD